MHMNSVPQHLLSEDRQDYERILDEALRSAPHNRSWPLWDSGSTRSNCARWR